MPAVVENSPKVELPPHKLWTREECAFLEREGLLQAETYELIDGELLIKMSKNHRHSLAILFLVTWLRQQLGAFFVVQEASIDLRSDDNERSMPEPDIAALSRPFHELAPRPTPEHIVLAVEVSDTSLGFDLGPKARLYARAAIPEYWVVDLNSQLLIVHRDPAGDAYRSVMAYAPNESVALLAAPASALNVASLF